MMKFFRNRVICQQNPYLYTGKVNNTSGVFSRRIIEKGGIIEECPVILLDPEQTGIVADTKLYYNYFITHDSPRQAVIALGFASLYNHGFPSNARCDYNAKKQLLIITAVEKILKGVEITLNYNGDPSDPASVNIQSK